MKDNSHVLSSYGENPELPTTIRHEFSEVVNLDDPEMWLKVCFQHAEVF
jgi:hypothetical protein